MREVYLFSYYLYRNSILNCGDSMTEERKHSIVLAGWRVAHP